MTDPDYILATAHFIQEAARRPGASTRTKALAEYARQRIREIMPERIARGGTLEDLEDNDHAVSGAATQEGE